MFEWLMMDASQIKDYSHAAGAHGGNHDMGPHKGAQPQDTFGCRCAWYAGQIVYYGRPRC